MVARERDFMARGIRESIVIRQYMDNNMNRDEGRYTLSHLYDDLKGTLPRE